MKPSNTSTPFCITDAVVFLFLLNVSLLKSISNSAPNIVVLFSVPSTSSDREAPPVLAPDLVISAKDKSIGKSVPIGKSIKPVSSCILVIIRLFRLVQPW